MRSFCEKREQLQTKTKKHFKGELYSISITFETFFGTDFCDYFFGKKRKRMRKQLQGKNEENLKSRCIV